MKYTKEWKKAFKHKDKNFIPIRNDIDICETLFEFTNHKNIDVLQLRFDDNTSKPYFEYADNPGVALYIHWYKLRPHLII